jgi:hypothetical protein
VACHLMCAGVSGPMSAGVNGPTRAVTEILVAGPTPAPAMVPTIRCRMANADLTFGAEPTRPESYATLSVIAASSSPRAIPKQASIRSSRSR